MRPSPRWPGWLSRKGMSATWRLSNTCRASYTTPIPPRPSSRTTSKSPSRDKARPMDGSGSATSILRGNPGRPGRVLL
jgi:hypothetical protein